MKVVEVFHDTICPWCRIGIKNLNDAVDQLGEPVEIRLHAFFLDPLTPAEGVPFKPMLTEKMGGEENYNAAIEQVTRVGEMCGLEFNFDKVELSPHTLMSHQMITLAPPHMKVQVVEAIDRAYFAEGKDIGNKEVLLEIGKQAGLDPEYIADFIGPDVRLKEIDLDIQKTFELGISQAPFFVIDGKYAVSGAQPVEAFLQALRMK
ncbi:DsbA family oxidoreductase [Paenibacillus sp. N1-5-1-14]|uniref:DsbA family oxidoreductase n=1 Tax=Paenibacillus radicibacter TaxID=2972488 RepID=UPI002158B4B2|nr:DsbA family oxidoreductase [Paenibacillus radicibacter]MCR8642454.1 DsbA family oxidoreductase [Paenibacillus radicibacter]